MFEHLIASSGAATAACAALTATSDAVSLRRRSPTSTRRRGADKLSSTSVGEVLHGKLLRALWLRSVSAHVFYDRGIRMRQQAERCAGDGPRFVAASTERAAGAADALSKGVRGRMRRVL